MAASGEAILEEQMVEEDEVVLYRDVMIAAGSESEAWMTEPRSLGRYA